MNKLCSFTQRDKGHDEGEKEEEIHAMQVIKIVHVKLFLE